MSEDAFVWLCVFLYFFIALGVYFVLKIIFAVKGEDYFDGPDPFGIAMGWALVLAGVIVCSPFWCVSKAVDVIIKSLKEQKGESSDGRTEE